MNDDVDSIKINYRKEKRPSHWREIVREYNLNGIHGLNLNFHEFLIIESCKKITENCLRKRLSRHNKDINRKTPKNVQGEQAPKYGTKIDDEL